MKWKDTPEAEAFIATADSRRTSREIMVAIAFCSANLDEAVAIWDGDGFGKFCHLSDLVEIVTKNGRLDPSEFFWGESGRDWHKGHDE